MTTLLRPSLLIALVALVSAAPAALAHDLAKPRDDTRPIADFPSLGALKVLSVDLHTHSVFSDGHVWPGLRAEEAARDEIDGVAITEHLEWQPHISDIPHPDRNRAYDCLLYTSPSPRDATLSRMPSSA